MENYASLYDMIQALQYGNRFHISVEFFNIKLRRALRLPFPHVIHATDFCNFVKNRPQGLARCLRCKGLANDKARRCKKPFAGHCVNGAYEYCYPVFKDDHLLCIIFVGNIIQNMEVFLRKSKISPDDPLIQTMEPSMPEAACEKIASTLGSYICMLTDSLPDTTPDPINTTILAAKSYIDCYFSHDITLASLAKLYHYNEKYMGALFKKQVGISFHDYLNNRRLYNARVLLANTRDSVLDVATRSGFNNVTYFNRIFKAKYGTTPTQYRLKHQKK